jgi:hypothetical protein
MKSRNELKVATAAAVIATVGDLMMLLVANSLRPDLDLRRPPDVILSVGGILGVAAIPFYALGYRAVACMIRNSSMTLSRIVLVFGFGAAAIGALIHGLTAFSIRESIASGAVAGSPLESIAASGGFLLVAWSIASFFVLTASFAILVAAGSPMVILAQSRHGHILSWGGRPSMGVGTFFPSPGITQHWACRLFLFCFVCVWPLLGA